MPKLGVNIDHVATLRQARGEMYPDPVAAARLCEKAGADSIVCHLREDRRHVVDADVKALRKSVKTRLNLEMSLAKSIVDIAYKIGPDEATFVPERRQEVTTEGGLDVVRYFSKVTRATEKLMSRDITINLFIDPVKKQIKAAHESGAAMIELHTGRYALAKTPLARKKELKKIITATEYALSLGLTVNAGHGLTLDNTLPIARIKGMTELNIGHSIIAHAVFVGIQQAVRDMKRVIRSAEKRRA